MVRFLLENTVAFNIETCTMTLACYKTVVLVTVVDNKVSEMPQ